MKLCHVLGSTVSVVKHRCYQGRTLLVVQPLGLGMQPDGPSFLASDAVGAGEGEVVLVVEEGKSAMQLFGMVGRTPLRSAVVAIVDRIDMVEESGEAVIHLFDVALARAAQGGA